MSPIPDATPGPSRRRALKLFLTAGGILAALRGGRSGPARAGETLRDAAVENSIEKANVMTSGWQRFALGEARITTILDGARHGDGPHPTFGADRSQEEMAALLRANFLPETRYVNGYTPVLVELDDNLILFDTGFGESGKENGYGKLVERMAAAGYGPEAVTIVVLTHLHPDHVLGLMTGGRPTFPNARYATGAREFEWWTSEEAKNGEKAGMAKTVENFVVPLEDRMTFLKDGDGVVSGITALDAPGHTPGHMVFELNSAGQRMMLTADTANHFVASLQKPDWKVGFDMDPDMAIATRKRVFDRIAAERIPFIGYHMPFPAVGYAEKLPEGGYRFVPETYQLAIANEDG
ncbi:MBL fold metallo-hydrolase [Jiella avicenniae]|uniref:MBL fold metallo-hydrolase n=1 Tax=Jiella avicenniae TaxID=2907202 RepID=A0A9X1T6N5_9HYPH|nr:MBL fold metallo-hydrolase [Jiella avicenniae]MCE7029545.1 MBL fold metallo-hydrolase [Jiella avicenniae]